MRLDGAPSFLQKWSVVRQALDSLERYSPPIKACSTSGRRPGEFLSTIPSWVRDALQPTAATPCVAVVFSSLKEYRRQSDLVISNEQRVPLQNRAIQWANELINASCKAEAVLPKHSVNLVERR